MSEDLTWAPTRRQEVFLTLPDWIFEALYGGAAGGGKTEALYMLPIVRKFYQHPKYKGIILRKTFPELESEIIIRSKPFYAATGGKYNEQKKRWVFPAGGYQAFGYTEREQDIRRYDGVEYNYVGWDEGTHFTEFQYRYLSFSRVRSSDSSLPAIVRTGTNPGNIGHKFFRSRFVDPARNGLKVLVDKNTGLKRIFIPAKLQDNPHLSENDPLYAAKLSQLGSDAEVRAKRDGDWYTFEGQVFNFRNEPFPDEPANACHICEPFEIPFWWPKLAAIDWGFSAHCWIGWFAIAPNGRVYLYREYFHKGKLVSEWALDFKRLSEKDNLVEVHLDPSAWQNRGIETIDVQFTKYSGYTAVKAVNDRVGGKMLLHDYLRWTPKQRIPSDTVFSPELAQKILTNYGRSKYIEYLQFFEEEPEEDNLPRLQVFNYCTAVPEAINQCVYDPENPEDVQEFSGDDPYDGIRYGLQAITRFLERAKQEGNKYEHYAMIEQQYREAQARRDMTQFYIHAPKLQQSSETYAVRPRRRR